MPEFRWVSSSITFALVASVSILAIASGRDPPYLSISVEITDSGIGLPGTWVNKFHSVSL